MKMNISHGGVCIFMLGVLLSCDPAAYVRPVADASYLFRAGGVNSDSIRPRCSETPSADHTERHESAGQPGREHSGDELPKKPARAGGETKWAGTGGLVSEPIGQTMTTSLIRLVLAACPGMEWDGIEKTGSATGSVFLGGRSL
ncbi:unnamed protein product [Lactuca saligna]|uniref:Uncharacterized protein n=1 Tax=Lactuca saligna TaxID=75948 RepID=A0AA35YP78_LACSI|nr:unnamed protein product [Lactuca saligna]